MKKDQILSLLVFAIFLIVTSLTYGIVTPVNQTTSNSSLVAVTNEITNNTSNDISNTTATTIPITNDYRIMIAITAGVVIAIVAIFLLKYW